MSASHARVALRPAGESSPESSGTDRAEPVEVFARRYAHAGMVRLGGEKMSKSLGNLVFVSALRESGIDPMAIRLAILAHHYRQDCYPLPMLPQQPQSCTRRQKTRT